MAGRQAVPYSSLLSSPGLISHTDLSVALWYQYTACISTRSLEMLIHPSAHCLAVDPESACKSMAIVGRPHPMLPIFTNFVIFGCSSSYWDIDFYMLVLVPMVLITEYSMMQSSNCSPRPCFSAVGL